MKISRLTKNLKAGSSLFKKTVIEMGAYAVAANLYPLGIFEEGVNSKKHTKFTINPRPVLFVHGIVHNRSAFYLLKKRLNKLNWENLNSFNYSTVHSGILQMVEDLTKKVDSVMRETGASQIDLVAHSLGGLVGRAFMTLGEGRGKVRTLVTLGTPHQGTNLSILAKVLSRGALDKDLSVNSFLIKLLTQTALPKNSRVISIYSPFDWTVQPSKNAEAIGIPAANFTNIKLDHVGHAGLLYSEKVFEEIVNALVREVPI